MQVTSSAQAPDTLWTKTLGGIFEDEGTVIIETIDKVFVVGGHKGDNVYDSAFVLGLNSVR